MVVATDAAYDPARREPRPRLLPHQLMFELNAANVLTLVRISLIPVLVAVLLSTLSNSDLLAAIVFILA